MNAKSIATQYFNEHPDAKDGVTKAYFAYHAEHIHENGAHNFTNGSRNSCCVWCGRSREMVRHDDLPAQCQKRPHLRPVEDVILCEERAAFALFERAKSAVPHVVKKRGLSGATLAHLHHTHGFDPETVSSVVPVPDAMIRDYEEEMERERERSRAAQKRVVVIAA